MAKEPCKFCSESKTHYVRLNATVDYSGIEVALNAPARTLRCRTYYYEPMDRAHGYDSTQDMIFINFCPMCGRRLT